MSDVRLIDANALMKHFATSQALVNDRDVLYCNGVLDVITREPTVDAVPVVRCRECKRSDSVTTPDGKVYCVAFDEYFPADGFCHDGKKMDGGAENV